jgi:hypothetical protein
MSLKEKVLEIANTQVGVEEIPRGSNKGKDVEKYLKSIGLRGGYAWCGAFTYWCVDNASKALKIANPLIKTGGVLKQWNERTELRETIPQSGDIFILDYGKGLGHTGFVECVDGLNIRTIEGNTNDEGSREGYEVCRRVRTIKSCRGFIRLV